jgi:hypothetical protein
VLAARVVKMGYRWKVVKCNKTRFSEDLWIDSSSLAIQHWELYCIVNEQNKSIADMWDGMNLKCTFHMCVDRRLLLMCEELVGLVSTIEFTKEEEAFMWQFQSSAVYSSQSLYVVINFPTVWKIVVPLACIFSYSLENCCPPRIHFFVWLLSKNKLLTRDNLKKKEKN